MEIPDRIKPYIARPGESKRKTMPPCAICGWSPLMAIHTNPQLNGRGPYHAFVVPKQAQREDV